MSASAGRRRRRAAEEEHENSERWLISYSDMITVLMALFIVLFAISQVDQQKFIALRESLAAGFNSSSTMTSVLDGTDGVQDGMTPQTSQDLPSSYTVSTPDPSQGQSSQADQATLAAAKAELDRLDGLKQQMAQALDDKGLTDQVTFRVTDRGLVVGLVANDVFFGAESAELTPTTDQVLDAMATVLAAASEDVSVEGHANIVPTSGRYPTNWELSADRATKVLRRLVEVDGLAGSRMSAVGFGDTRPLATGTDEASLAANRRVDVVILSGASEDVRALLPALAGN